MLQINTQSQLMTEDLIASIYKCTTRHSSNLLSILLLT